MLTAWFSKDTATKLFLGVLALGAALRVIAAFTSIGFESGNEIYRLLEPIAKLQGYTTVLPFEWDRGMLSWLPVLLQFYFVEGLKLLGVDHTVAQGSLLRLLYATVSLVPVWLTWSILKKRSFPVALIGSAWVAAWPEFVFRSVRLMDYTLEAAFYGSAIGLVAVRNKTDPFFKAGVAFAGVLLGALFFVRYQSGLFFVALLLVILFCRPWDWRSVLYFTVAYTVTLLVLGWTESQLFGKALFSPLVQYLQYNIGESGAVRDFGSDPWHRYVSETAKVFAYVPFAGFVFLLFQKSADRSLQVLFLFPLAAYSLIAHKEGRFVYGFAWLLVPAGLSACEGVIRPRWVLEQAQKFWRKWFFKAGVFALVLVFFWIQGERVSRRFGLQSDNVRDFSKVGQYLEKVSPPYPLLWIESAPQFVPGAFFLRYRGPICFQFNHPGSCASGSTGRLILRGGRPQGEGLLFRGESWGLYLESITPKGGG